MMDCDGLVAKLYEFLDGELDGGSCEEIRAHLDACRPCMDQADLEKAFQALLRRRCCEQAPEGMLDRVRERLNRGG